MSLNMMWNSRVRPWYWMGIVLITMAYVSRPVFTMGADELLAYTVTITNQTHGQLFAAPLAVSHTKQVRLFTVGEPAGAALAAIAEGANTGPLVEMLQPSADVGDVVRADLFPPKMDPGTSATLTIMAGGDFKWISIVGMLNPTNDGFFAVQGVKIRKDFKPVVIDANAYDAGSEPNDELCPNIGGGFCVGQGPSPEAGGEGFVHVHPGIHGEGDLRRKNFDWRNPVAKISIQRAE